MTQESITMLKWSTQQFKNFCHLNSVSLESDPTENPPELTLETNQSTKPINLEFQKDPINLFYIQLFS